jgi:hypothetical protein
VRSGEPVEHSAIDRADGLFDDLAACVQHAVGEQ